VRRGPDVLQRSVQSGSDLLSDRPLGVDGCGYGGSRHVFPVDNVNALDTQRHFGEPIRRGKRDRREGRDDRLDRLAGLAYAASVRAFAAAGAEWLATPSVGPRRRSDSPAPMFGPSWGLFVDKLVGPGREAGEPAHWSWLIAGV